MRKKAVLVLMAGVVAVMAIVWSWSTEIEAISPSDIIVQQGGGSATFILTPRNEVTLIMSARPPLRYGKSPARATPRISSGTPAS